MVNARARAQVIFMTDGCNNTEQSTLASTRQETLARGVHLSLFKVHTLAFGSSPDMAFLDTLRTHVANVPGESIVVRNKLADAFDAAMAVIESSSSLRGTLTYDAGGGETVRIPVVLSVDRSANVATALFRPGEVPVDRPIAFNGKPLERTAATPSLELRVAHEQLTAATPRDAVAALALVDETERQVNALAGTAPRAELAEARNVLAAYRSFLDQAVRERMAASEMAQKWAQVATFTTAKERRKRMETAVRQRNVLGGSNNEARLRAATLAITDAPEDLVCFGTGKNAKEVYTDPDEPGDVLVALYHVTRPLDGLAFDAPWLLRADSMGTDYVARSFALPALMYHTKKVEMPLGTDGRRANCLVPMYVNEACFAKTRLLIEHILAFMFVRDTSLFVPTMYAGLYAFAGRLVATTEFERRRLDDVLAVCRALWPEYSRVMHTRARKQADQDGYTAAALTSNDFSPLALALADFRFAAPAYVPELAMLRTEALIGGDPTRADALIADETLLRSIDARTAAQLREALHFGHIGTYTFSADDFSLVDEEVVYNGPVYVSPPLMPDHARVRSLLSLAQKEASLASVRTAALRYYAIEIDKPSLSLDELASRYISATLEQHRASWEVRRAQAQRLFFGDLSARLFAQCSSLERAEALVRASALGDGSAARYFDALCRSPTSKHVVAKAVLLTCGELLRDHQQFSPSRERVNAFWRCWNSALTLDEWKRVFPDDKRTRQHKHSTHELLAARLAGDLPGRL